MTFLYILLTVYILAVNFYGYRFVRAQRDGTDAGEPPAGDGKLFLAAFFGGAIAIYASLFAMRYRLSSFILMIGLPLLSVLNLYCYFLAYRSIWLFL